MASIEKVCAYVECDKTFYGGKRAMYCCGKHGTYQRRLDRAQDAEIENGRVYFKKVMQYAK